MIETTVVRGIQIERTPFEQQLAASVEELKNNEGLARSQGITDQSLPQPGPL